MLAHIAGIVLGLLAAVALLWAVRFDGILATLFSLIWGTSRCSIAFSSLYQFTDVILSLRNGCLTSKSQGNISQSTE